MPATKDPNLSLDGMEQAWCQGASYFRLRGNGSTVHIPDPAHNRMYVQQLQLGCDKVIYHACRLTHCRFLPPGHEDRELRSMLIVVLICRVVNEY